MCLEYRVRASIIIVVFVILPEELYQMRILKGSLTVSTVRSCQRVPFNYLLFIFFFSICICTSHSIVFLLNILRLIVSVVHCGFSVLNLFFFFLSFIISCREQWKDHLPIFSNSAAYSVSFPFPCLFPCFVRNDLKSTLSH